jgi:hypothetical protein
MNEAIEVMADQVEEENVVSFLSENKHWRTNLGMTDL